MQKNKTRFLLSEVIVDKYISEKDKNFDISEIPLKIESNEIINS
jgi:hypothetical protein